jgi:hypothetical protein
MSTSLDITVTLVQTDGRIDLDQSTAAFRSAALKRQAELETEKTEIAAAVSAIFDQHYGKSIPMPTLGSMVAQALNAQPENFAVLSERALNYVRENSQGEVKDGVEERPNSLFVISKGKGGGCGRRADLPVKPAKGSKTV